MRILIVRLSALGDIVHALPVLAAIRDRLPGAEVDWIVDARYAAIFDHVEGLRRRVVVGARSDDERADIVSFAGRSGFLGAVRHLRGERYDVALDLQGLIKSAALAGLSGAGRVIGFAAPALREPQAGWFYSETADVSSAQHIIAKNLAMLPLIGVEAGVPRLPIRAPVSRVADEISDGSRRYALINPGGGWPNKRWPPVRFGELAARLRDELGLRTYVLWGRGEEALADAVAAHSSGAATSLPSTTLGDLLAVASRASLMISGDTGPLHLAAAVDAPIVGIYGPTWPARNGPWHPDDVTVSRAAACSCHHKRRCQRSQPCLDEVSVDEVFRAAARRLRGEERRA